MAMDLSVIAAVLSSNVDTPIEQGLCMAGEVGLSGEIRPVARIEQRISEAEKLGFSEIIIPRQNMQGLDYKKIQYQTSPRAQGRRGVAIVVRVRPKIGSFHFQF